MIPIRWVKTRHINITQIYLCLFARNMSCSGIREESTGTPVLQMYKYKPELGYAFVVVGDDR
jgi:hypothetical protein